MRNCLLQPLPPLRVYSPFGAVLEGRTFSSEEYRYGFNGMERETSTAADNYDFGARILDGRLGRWLSVDALTKETPFQTPYHYAGNAPIYLVDNGGNENIIYLLVTDNGNKAIAKEGITAEDIAKAANFMFGNLGVKTEVRIFEGKPEDFSILKMDHTDAVCVIGGNATDTKDFIREELDPNFANTTLKDWEGGASNPERSENNIGVIDKSDPHAGEIIAIDGSSIREFSFGYNRLGLGEPKDSKKQSEVMTKVFGLTILHGAGHNAGLNHGGPDSGPRFQNSYVMRSANEMGPFWGGKFSLDAKGFDAYTSAENNFGYIKYLTERFNALNEPVDNMNKGQ
jgi:RHS repeat-associated protein